MYPESVEELSSKPLLDASQGEDQFFHASGREDIDARMLGTGQTFRYRSFKTSQAFC